MAAHRVDLGDHTDAEPGLCLGGGNRRSQASPPAPYDEHITREHIHRGPQFRRHTNPTA